VRPWHCPFVAAPCSVQGPSRRLRVKHPYTGAGPHLHQQNLVALLKDGAGGDASTSPPRLVDVATHHQRSTRTFCLDCDATLARPRPRRMFRSIDGTGANRPRRPNRTLVAVSRLSHWTGWSLGVTPRAREWSRSHSTAGLIGVPFDWPANFLFIQLTHSDPDREWCDHALHLAVVRHHRPSDCSRRGRLVRALRIRKATGIHCTCTSRRGVTGGWPMAVRGCFSFLGKRFTIVLC
jgi:hypothetical protein